MEKFVAIYMVLRLDEVSRPRVIMYTIKHLIIIIIHIIYDATLNVVVTDVQYLNLFITNKAYLT